MRRLGSLLSSTDAPVCDAGSFIYGESTENLVSNLAASLHDTIEVLDLDNNEWRSFPLSPLAKYIPGAPRALIPFGAHFVAAVGAEAYDGSLTLPAHAYSRPIDIFDLRRPYSGFALNVMQHRAADGFSVAAFGDRCVGCCSILLRVGHRFKTTRSLVIFGGIADGGDIVSDGFVVDWHEEVSVRRRSDALEPTSVCRTVAVHARDELQRVRRARPLRVLRHQRRRFVRRRCFWHALQRD